LNKIAQLLLVTENYHGLFDGKQLHSFTLKNAAIEIDVTNLAAIFYL
jgi:hypothetical protein